MITKWKVANFKSIYEETELELAPLTIFAGANSSGKSTFIQSILLVAQTLSHKVGSRSVVLNGALTSLGQFDDIKSDGSELDQIVFKCTCRPFVDAEKFARRRSALSRRNIYNHLMSSQLRELSCEIIFDADPSSPQKDLLQMQPRIFSSELRSTSRDEDNVDEIAEISISPSIRGLSKIDGIDENQEIDDRLRGGLLYDVHIDAVSMAEVKENFRSAHPIGCVLQHFLPSNIIYGIDPVEENANTIANALQGGNRYGIGSRYRVSRDIVLTSEIISVLRDVLQDSINFDEVFVRNYQQQLMFSEDTESISLREWNDRLRQTQPDTRTKILRALRDSEDLFERIHGAIKEQNSSLSESRDIVQISPPRQISSAARYLSDFFASSLKYLGPLRDAPKPVYPLSPAVDPHDIGLLGEHTASILELHKDKKIRYIPSTQFKEARIDRKMITRSLEAAVIDWLQYLGVAKSVQSKDLGKLGHELKVSLNESDSAQDLTHVGVGVSQVLPILVMCLLADTDSTLVFEQPELHLHPKVQTLLGDFFLSMTMCNKQCIVETHSEYFIDRLRFRIAAATSTSELNSKAKIYFVSKPSQNSEYSEVVINEYGAISDWPEGFFDQSQQQAEEILRAAAMKRKVARDRSNG